MASHSAKIRTWSVSGHSQHVEIESIGRPLWSLQKEYKKPEPSYDLPSSSSCKKQDHQDEEKAQPVYRVRRPAPPSIEQDRKTDPFSKIPVTFMFHATYGAQLESILDQGIRTGASSTPRGRIHVHPACIGDILVDDEQSEAALTHVPTGRDARDPCLCQGQSVLFPALRGTNCINRSRISLQRLLQRASSCSSTSGS